MTRARRWSTLGVAIALSMIAVAALRGQPEPPRRHETRWVVVTDPATDLWYHTLAVLGVHGPGTLPLYDSDYAQAIAAEKARRAVGPTALDREATRLKRAIMADSAFEVLHFLPLYLDRTPPEALPRALRQIAIESRATVAPERVLGALRSSLSSRAERQVLSDLADVIEDEWQTFYADYAASRAALVAERRRVLQSRWDTAFAPRLDPVFRAVGARGGVLLISPPLGIDGRVVNLGVAGMIVAVSDAVGESAADAPLLAAIRELCFPLLQHIRDVDPVARAHAARGADESGGAAVQCGAWLVDALMPSLAIEYRALFLPARVGESPATYRRRFDQRFAIDAATAGALSQLITGNSSHPSLPLGR